MSRVNQIFQSDHLYIGPAPSSGYHFISGDGTLHNNYTDFTDSYNLVKPLARVQEASYSFNVDYQELKQLGKRGTVYSPVIVQPSVNVNFTYLQNSVLNELRLGLNANYLNENTETVYYNSNFGQSLVSGLLDRKYEQPSSAPYWPLSSRDRRNLFLAVGPRGSDISETIEAQSDPKNAGYYVYSFGDSYLTSYNSRGSVGSFPTATISFICDNLEVFNNGSGVNIPALNSRTGGYVNNNKFVIPSNYDGPDQVSVLLPGDTNLSFYALPHRTGILALYGSGYAPAGTITDIPNLGIKYSDIKVQSYDIGLNLQRNALYSLGYRYPVDRPLAFPIYATLNTSVIIGDNQTGALNALVDQNRDYNLTLTIQNPTFSTRSGIGLQYDFLRAKLINWNIDSAIGPSKIVTLGFATEIDPDDLSKGLFISGRMNITSADNQLLKQDDGTMFLLSNLGTDVISSIKTHAVAF